MATLCVIGAVVARLKSFDSIPGVYSFDVPPSVDNAQVYPNYCVVLDGGMRPTFELELTVMEQTDIDVMIYANTLEEASEIAEIVKYNGGAIDAGAGMDFGSLPDLATQYRDMQVERVGETYFAATATGRSAQRISGCKLSYRVTLYRYT